MRDFGIRIKGRLEYKVKRDMLGDTVVYTAYHSNSSMWKPNVRNTVAMKVIDNGNGLLLSQDKHKQLDYSEAEILKHILNKIKI